MKRYLSLVTMLFVTSATAATIEPKNDLEILFIDGVKVEEKRESVDIQPGLVQLVVKYTKKLKDSGKDRVYDSAPYVVNLDAPDADLTISGPKLFSYSQANTHFKKDPEWKVETESGQAIEYTQEVLDRGDGIFPYYDMPKLVREHNEKRGLVVGSGAALAATAQDANATVVEVAETGEKTVVQLDTSNLDQLKAWYLKSSKEDRKEFRRWMIDQE
ncbi:DUF2057 domain-containing protein [Vibrio aquaticus]|uniref:UPF0319 protein EJ063_11280 n=1 Tax=Vibrio aquaticus TaxID=2496559 RepID=A0A432CVC3_9VIBR|nr:DUF2057 domain-containing protein [Vibrio aquaticus]RTZ15653.1 DUF2057 domain-containing protein [Vibrio aquaticus]